MEKAQARAIVKSVLAIGEHLNRLHEIGADLPIEAKRKAFKGHLGAAMAELNADILLPIVREYPDLDPDRGMREDVFRQEQASIYLLFRFQFSFGLQPYNAP
jgi:hypothetical protein